MPDERLAQVAQATPSAWGRLWRWFLAGFLIVLVGMSLTMTMHVVHPSGRAVVECRLWQYYLIEARRELSGSNDVVGPGSANTSGLLTTALQHFVCSIAGGAAIVGIAWAVRKLRNRTSGAAT